MRRLHLIIYMTLALCMASVSLHAQRYELVAVTSEEGVIDGATYFITAHPSKSSKKYESLKVESNASGMKGLVTLIGIETKKTYNNPYDACKASDLFKIRNANGERHLFCTAIGQYIGMDTIGYKAEALTTDTPDANSRLSFEEKGGQLYLKVNDYRYLEFAASDHRFGFYTNIDKELPILLYRLSYPSTDTLVVDGNGLTAPVHRHGDVVLRRQFHEDGYNTLCLPFDIDDYKAVFGQHVTAYSLSEATDSSITFTVAATLRLEACKPYLLSGTFGGTDEYTIPDTDIDYDGAATTETTLGGLTFHAVWQPQTLSHDRHAFIFYKDRFVNGKNQSRVAVAPAHWYVTTQAASRPLRMNIARKR